jgi:hypothetical protein
MKNNNESKNNFYEALSTKISNILPTLNEKQRRLYLANEAIAIGYGGISLISNLSGASRMTITSGIKEIQKNEENDLSDLKKNRCRSVGGGRKKATDTQQNLKKELKTFINPYTKGNPTKPILWVSKSLRQIAAELTDHGFNISHTVVSSNLKEMGFSLQANHKSLAIKPSHPDRDAQFQFISKQTEKFLKNNYPVISVDTKKKENIGNFKNNGLLYCKKGEPIKVLDHDFPIQELGKAVPYGVYLINNNCGFMNVGISSDTAEFAVESIRRWWYKIGIVKFPNTSKIYITADSGGSNGNRVRLWKYKLQELADETGLQILVSHYPSGTSKWNAIEHRLFSFVTINWKGIPLSSLATIISLIASTKTDKGLECECVEDKNMYEKGQLVTDEEFATINIKRNNFHGEWNYKISPRKK